MNKTLFLLAPLFIFGYSYRDNLAIQQDQLPKRLIKKIMLLDSLPFIHGFEVFEKSLNALSSSIKHIEVLEIYSEDGYGSPRDGIIIVEIDGDSIYYAKYNNGYNITDLYTAADSLLIKFSEIKSRLLNLRENNDVVYSHFITWHYFNGKAEYIDWDIYPVLQSDEVYLRLKSIIHGE